MPGLRSYEPPTGQSKPCLVIPEVTSNVSRAARAVWVARLSVCPAPLMDLSSAFRGPVALQGDPVVSGSSPVPAVLLNDVRLPRRASSIAEGVMMGGVVATVIENGAPRPPERR